jgi:trigger factor
MQSQVDQISKVLVELKVEVPWERVSKGLEDAYRVLQRQAHVRGFRKGKVPRHVVKNLMGKRVKEDVASTLVQEGLTEAIKEHSLDIVAVPELDEPAIEDGQPMSFKAKLEVRPKIESVDTSALVVERKVEAVTDEQVGTRTRTSSRPIRRGRLARATSCCSTSP